MPRVQPDPRARRRRVDAPWRLALLILVWFMLAAQAPLDLQVPEDNPRVEIPALPPLLPGALDERADRQELPIVSTSPSKPRTGPDSLSSFIGGFRGNDAVLELVMGQGRILSTRADLSGQASKAVIAVGDPSVMDFVVLSPRQLRLIGHRLGTTDLSITTTDGQIFNFEVTWSPTSLSSKCASSPFSPTRA